MKIILFGATGATGILLTQVLLDAGHEVTVYIRNVSKMHIEHPKLKVLQGELREAVSLKKALMGQDAVVSCLGSNTTRKSDQLTKMAEGIAEAMKETGVTRIVYMATAGIDDEFKGIFKLVIRMILGNVIDDHRHAAMLYRQSEFDYTIVRPMQLKDGEATGRYVTAKKGLPSGRKAVSRADVAAFIAEIIDDVAYYGTSIAMAEA